MYFKTIITDRDHLKDISKYARKSQRHKIVGRKSCSDSYGAFGWVLGQWQDHRWVIPSSLPDWLLPSFLSLILKQAKTSAVFGFPNHKWHQILEAEYCLEKKELSTSRLKCFILAESQLSQMWYLAKKKQTNKSWKTFLDTIYFLSSSFMKIHEALRGQTQRLTTSINTVDLIASGWRGIAQWFKQTGG